MQNFADERAFAAAFQAMLDVLVCGSLLPLACHDVRPRYQHNPSLSPAQIWHHHADPEVGIRNHARDYRYQTRVTDYTLGCVDQCIAFVD